MWPYPLASGPVQPLDRSRRCAFWVSPWVADAAIIDTAALQDDQMRLAGRDAFPPDCLLVVIHPRSQETIRQQLAALTFPMNPALLAADMIDEQCRRDPKLADRLRWRSTVPA